MRVINMLNSRNESSVKTFHFTDETDVLCFSCSSDDSENSETDIHVCAEKCLNIRIAEVFDPSYGMYVWPCATVLAQFIWYNRETVKGKKVLEIGAGTALPSITAAKCGAHVIISDAEEHTITLKGSQHNAELNGLSSDMVQVIGLSWNAFSPNLIQLEPVNIILGSDVFYEPMDFEDVIVTITYLLEKNPGAEFWCTYQERSSDWTVDFLLDKWNLACEEILLEEFLGDSHNIANSNLPGDCTVHFFLFRSQST